MTSLQATLFALLAVMAVGWFAAIGKLARQLKHRHPAVHAAMGLERLGREARSRLNLMGNEAVRELVRFAWRRGDAPLGDPEITRLVLFLRVMLVGYVVLLAALAATVFGGDHALSSSATVPTPPSAQMETIARLPGTIAASSHRPGQDARARRAEGVPDGDAAAVRVEAIPREAAQARLQAHLLPQEVLALQRGHVAQDLRGSAPWISHRSIASRVRPWRARRRGIA